MFIVAVSMPLQSLLMLAAVFTFAVRREIGSVLGYLPGLNRPFWWALPGLSTHLTSPQSLKELDVSAGPHALWMSALFFSGMARSSPSWNREVFSLMSLRDRPEQNPNKMLLPFRGDKCESHLVVPWVISMQPPPHHFTGD